MTSIKFTAAHDERDLAEMTDVGERIDAREGLVVALEAPRRNLGVAVQDGQRRHVDRAGLAREGEELVIDRSGPDGMDEHARARSQRVLRLPQARRVRDQRKADLPSLV